MGVSATEPEPNIKRAAAATVPAYADDISISWRIRILGKYGRRNIKSNGTGTFAACPAPRLREPYFGTSTIGGIMCELPSAANLSKNFLASKSLFMLLPSA